MNRRQFLALAGAAGVALGPGQVAADAVRTQTGSGGVLPRPAWVRSVATPTLWLDEATYARFDKRRCVFATRFGGSFGLYVGKEREQIILEGAQQAVAKMASRPGFRPRDRALAAAAGAVSSSLAGPNSANRGLLSWTALAAGTRETISPQGWSSADQCTRDVKVAARFYGAALVGICKLDVRHVYSYDLDGRAVVFADVPEPYEVADYRVIPERCRHAVVFAVRMSPETVKRAPTALVSAVSNLAYVQLQQVAATIAQFLRVMGYTAIPCVNDTAASVPLAVDAGLGELARHNRLITPEYGAMVRLGKVITDAPLLPDSPIDAGIATFCRTCAKCAEACPAAALSFLPEPDWTPRGPWNNAGHLAWYEDSVKCFQYNNEINTNCMICFSVCPYSKKAKAAAHGLVKATIAHTDAFNGALRSVDDAFGYGGQKSPDEWWDLDLPPGGID
ncbi:MAG: reductive dehalogenase [Chloroflexota bacterium]